MTSASPSGLAEALGHDFADESLLLDALTHPSLMGLGRRSGQNCVSPYERLEFLGDRVLGLVIAEWLLDRFPKEKEGALAKRHAGLVNRDIVGERAQSFDLGRYLRLSPAEEGGGGRHNVTILADACEAVIGALYLDGGLDPARRFIRQVWTDAIEREEAPPVEAKTALQEWAQGRGRPLPVYELIDRTGPDHDPQFRVKVTVEGVPDACGAGTSKRAAEKDAARTMLRQLGVTTNDG
jgi:ribonuclease III